MVEALPVLATAACQRVAFAESAVQGSTVMEIDPGSVASQEIGVVDEVLVMEGHPGGYRA